MLKFKNDHHILSALSICCVLVYFAASSTYGKTQIGFYLKNIPVSLNRESSHIEGFNHPEHTTTLKTPIETPIDKSPRTSPTVPINKQILHSESSKIDINYVRQKCELHKHNAQLEKTQKQTTLWNSQASDKKKARPIIMQYPYRQLRYFRDLREGGKGGTKAEKPYKKNVILCLPPKSGSSSWEVLMVENMWNKTTHFLEGGVVSTESLARRHSTKSQIIPMKNPSQLVSFSGLLNFMVNAGKKGLRNIHWTPMTEQCGPCSINYDYITQLETISEDIKKIADELNFGENSKFPELNKKAGLVYENQSERLAKIYFEKGVTIEVVDRIREIYFLDFELFGYDFERFRVKFLQHTKE